MMYLNVFDFVFSNLSRRWWLELEGGAVLEGRFDRRQFQRLKELKEQGEFDLISHFKFAVFRTSRQPCIVNVKSVVIMAPIEVKK